jgi:hypothetical protein
MYFISKVLFNTNNDNTKKCISFLSSGGFTYYNKPDEKKTLCPIVLKNRSQILKYLNEFFIQKNKQLQESITSYEQNAGIVFFPIHYMQPISVTPVYIVYKSRKILQSWDIFYKIEISAFKNVSSGKTEHCNLLDRGISITISANGIVSGVKYNLLPFSHISKDEMYKVHNEIGFSPQIVYLLNTDNNLISPFYLSLSERKLIPASKQSFILQEQITEIFKNPMEFNENRVVVWLGDSINSEVSGNDNNLKSFNIPPPGAKLIRLKPKSEESLLTPCLYWWNGQYQFGDFPEKDLTNSNDFISKYSGKTFNNDIIHLLKRISAYINACSIYQSVESLNSFKLLINSIKSFSSTVLNEIQIKNAHIALSNLFAIDVNNKPDTIARFTESIFSVYNPKIKNVYCSDEILVLPLSQSWFNSNPYLKERYKSVWEVNPSLIGKFTGKCGEGVTYKVEPEFSDIKNELLQLKDFVKAKGIENCPIVNWINGLTSESLSNYKTIIFISDDSWTLDANVRYADSVAIENSFGPYKLPPLMSILIHEFTVNSDCFLDFILKSDYGSSVQEVDSHISKEQTEVIWDKINNKSLNINVAEEYEIDRIFQCQRAYATISLGIIINAINQM